MLLFDKSAICRPVCNIKFQGQLDYNLLQRSMYSLTRRSVVICPLTNTDCMHMGLVRLSSEPALFAHWRWRHKQESMLVVQCPSEGADCAYWP